MWAKTKTLKLRVVHLQQNWCYKTTEKKTVNPHCNGENWKTKNRKDKNYWNKKLKWNTHRKFEKIFIETVEFNFCLNSSLIV